MKCLRSCLVMIYFLNALIAQGFTVQNKSELYLFDQKWEFNYNLDLNEYFYTAILLDECAEKLKFICGTKGNNSCNYFIDSISNTKLEANSQIFKVQHNAKRKKRFAILIAALIAGVTMMSLLVGISTNVKKVKQLESTLQDTVNTLKSSVDLSSSSTDLQETVIYNTDQTIYDIEKRIQNMTQKIFDDQAINNLIFTVIFQILKYQTYQNKLNLLFTNEFRENLFDIVDFQNFSRTIEHINRDKLPSNLFIPQIKLGHGNELINAFWKINETNLSVILHLPVLNRNKYVLRELIPIPVIDQNITYILNLPSTLFFKFDSKMFNFTNRLNSKYCIEQGDLTVCNSLILDDLQEVSSCAKRIIQENSKDYCLFETISHRNYLIEISKSLLYASIVKPMDILMQCMGFEKEITLNKSQFLPFARDCNIFKRTYPNLSDPRITSINLTNKFIKPNLSLIPENNTLMMEKIPIFDRHTREFESKRRKIEELKKNISIIENNIDQITGEDSFMDWFSETWNSIRELFSGTIVKFATYILICLILVQICVSIVKKIIDKMF